MVIGIVGFGFLLEYLLANHVLATCLTFVGLILGGLPILWLSLRSNLKKTPGRHIGVGEVLCFLILLAIGIGLPLLQGSEGAIKTLSVDFGTVILLFLLGLIASATMVIPGVSGSMVLMVLGYYSTILSLVTGTVTMLKDLDLGGVIHNCLLLVPFAVGCGAGDLPHRQDHRIPVQPVSLPDLRGNHRSDSLLPLCHPLLGRCAQRIFHSRTYCRPGAGGAGCLGHLADGRQGRELIELLAHGQLINGSTKCVNVNKERIRPL